MNRDNEMFIVENGVLVEVNVKEDYSGSVLDIPETVNEIRINKYEVKHEIPLIRLPKTVKYIDEDSLEYFLRHFSKIEVNPENEYFSVVDDILYNKEKTILLFCPDYRYKGVCLPNTVKEIANGAFKWARSSFVVLNEGLEKIGEHAFVDSIIEEIEIPKTVKIIECEAFSYCTDMKKLIINPGVETIGERAFEHCRMNKVIIPKTVRKIGDKAFADCTSLETLELMEGLREIGDAAYAGCCSLKKARIPASVNKIGENCFDFCGSIENFEVATENESYCFVDGILYDKDQKKLIKCFNNCPEVIKIPETVREIEQSAFGFVYDDIAKNCLVGEMPERLKRIIIPNGVEVIGAYAFHNCGDIEIELTGENIKSIGSFAFSRCYNISEKINLKSLESLGFMVFEGCISLTEIKFGVLKTSIDSCTFYANENLRRIEISAFVEKIDNTAFWGCLKLEEIIIDENNPIYKSVDGVVYDKSVSRLIFCPAGYAGELVIPDTVEIVESGSYDFEWGGDCDFKDYIGLGLKSRITKLVIPNSVKTIGNCAFIGCGFEELVLGNGIESIGYASFYDCENLRELVVPKNVKYIGEYTFSGCTGVKKVVLESEKMLIKRELPKGGTRDYYVNENELKSLMVYSCKYYGAAGYWELIQNQGNTDAIDHIL